MDGTQKSNQVNGVKFRAYHADLCPASFSSPVTINPGPLVTDQERPVLSQGMLDNNRNSGSNIGPATDAIAWMASNATTPRQQIWRMTNTYAGTVDGTHYPPVLVEPTTSKCS
jgi:hypothetical protein